MAPKKDLEIVTEPNDRSAILTLVAKTGELTGLVHAVLSEQVRFNGELVRLGNELDHKHEDNIRLISSRHEENQRVQKINHDENQKLLADHKIEDSKSFARVFKWMNMLAGASGLLVIIWAIVTFIVPILMKSKLGE